VHDPDLAGPASCPRTRGCDPTRYVSPSATWMTSRHPRGWSDWFCRLYRGWLVVPAARGWSPGATAIRRPRHVVPASGDGSGDRHRMADLDNAVPAIGGGPIWFRSALLVSAVVPCARGVARSPTRSPRCSPSRPHTRGGPFGGYFNSGDPRSSRKRGGGPRICSVPDSTSDWSPHPRGWSPALELG